MQEVLHKIKNGAVNTCLMSLELDLTKLSHYIGFLLELPKMGHGEENDG